ncbi:MAG: phosphoribosylaminoimidazolesuccinocarboxamide synthase [Chlamydiota bacterium]|jgi:phosphoribosylaminoimidazole-succinocarboxamide synthase
MQHSLTSTFIPELGEQTEGKVRGMYSYNSDLLMITSDRISIFNRLLDQPILDKGRILTQLSLFWFEKTKDIINNHLIFSPDPNVMIVKKCRPIRIEVIVRKYAVGSLWRDFTAGKRSKCGIKLPEHLKENQEFVEPIITPTTKNSEGNDEDISKQQILEQKIIDPDLYCEIERKALALFKRGEAILKDSQMILVDTKYEFGLDENNNLLLIDEIHTPDSSRFWFAKDVKAKNIRFFDKEFTRNYFKEKGFLHDTQVEFPQELQGKIREGYLLLYEKITKKKFAQEYLSTPKRILQRLKNAKILRGVFALIIADLEVLNEVKKLTDSLKENQIPHKVITNPDVHELEKIYTTYNLSIEPMVYITISRKNLIFANQTSKYGTFPHIACVLNQSCDTSECVASDSRAKPKIVADVFSCINNVIATLHKIEEML